ncbi:relaxase/mobilization nuclease domain-containing protein [Acetobacter estunensis]|uniref:relaxase/mobilization nuclease domain-containing protein n=1 Tax=Acetobacter estunensis TaxID=104097 RepID=UPI001C2DA7B8|nr:relaxase/mobilization nuclease domain-containing protein [Acetobacter estunensis]MBV1838462.1 relaxase/mobilization nuclease domain-containing protein [Acetobacter estunensis]
MIIKSNPITANSLPSDIFNYCTANTKNESVEMLSGEYQDVADCFSDAETWNRKNSLLHMQMSSKEPLSNEQFLDLRERVKKEFNLSDSDIVTSSIHEYTRKNDPDADPRHLHLLIRMINPENGKPLDLSNKYQRQEKISRMFEVDHGLELVKGRHNVAVWHNVPEEYKEKLYPLTLGDLPNSFLRDGQYQNMKRIGGKPFDIKNEAIEILSRCDSFQAFQNAIQEKGWTIEQGTKKLILNDENGKFVGCLDRVLGMKKADFEQFIDGHEIKVASPILSRTLHVPTTNKLAKGDALSNPEAVQKTPENKPAPKAPQKPETPAGHIHADLASDATQATDAMTSEEKQAIASQNSDKAQARRTMQESIASQERMAKALEDLMKQQQKEGKSWTQTIDDEERKLIDIINMKPPKLKEISDKSVRNWIYKNYSGELKTIKDRKEKLWELRDEIKELRAGARWYNSKEKQADKKETDEKEKAEKLQLMIMHVVHTIMYELGLTKVCPNPWNSLTNKEKQEYLIRYKSNQYA